MVTGIAVFGQVHIGDLGEDAVVFLDVDVTVPQKCKMTLMDSINNDVTNNWGLFSTGG